jgi:hypothetical protein
MERYKKFQIKKGVERDIQSYSAVLKSQEPVKSPKFKKQ